MKYYIASRLENEERVRALRDALAAQGHEQTYDWTTHGAVHTEGLPRLEEVCLKELAGIANADLVIVLLPGGRGTHAELGYALGRNKLIYAWAPSPEYFEPCSATCAFYHHPLVTRSTFPFNVLELTKRIEQVEKDYHA